MNYMSILMFGASIMGLFSCQTLKSHMDLRGLRDYARSLENQLKERVPHISAEGSEIYSRSVVGAARPQTESKNFIVERQPLDRWTVSVPHLTVVGERLTFPAEEGSALGQSYFYYFHPENTHYSKAILWAPGFGVSDFAFFFIKRFFQIELELGWSVLVWVPPFHLERQIRGKDAGEGLISPDLNALVADIETSVKELDQAFLWLTQSGYERIGAWGGSFGAANLLLLAQNRAFDHLTVMIPLLDWNTLWASSPFMGIQNQFASAGIPAERVASVLASVSPRYGAPPKIQADRIQFLIADYDQLTPLAVTSEYLGRLGPPEGPGPQVYRFKESHSTILINSGVYRAYREFLQAMQ